MKAFESSDSSPAEKREKAYSENVYDTGVAPMFWIRRNIDGTAQW